MAESLISLDSGRHRTKVRLRVGVRSAEEARRLLDLAPVGTARLAGQVTSLCTGPDQWLLISDRFSADELIVRCERALTSISHHAVDVSAAFGCAQLLGRHARNLLAMGTGIDCGQLGTSECRSIRFARIQASLHAIEVDQFDLYYDNSFRHYLQQWFSQAARDPLFENDVCLNTS